ncbi:sulfurtransferase complex subunit TusC [Shewanella fidelis]|uniref:Sulfurtransferase complex subunit TusC n=1 Tax=Shewanella fidelis TaxID=173509 RepID=A0AAW8NKS1_9GAMM|nr:sulfurtransferase complex subunit TusC [Shewanella fidelis]MDR8523798.1 sulfurtransferase complex subunit TusC [Shewanella fidelis]MDW4810346.1 sulfurtransferase complex subunit TusC [Shewanella fidelis]MDW4814491.1 sulfurtransferase complex subunit TusC [Shewanella fidelis]MDW4818581.1 sulfurtransferase complex subunit TusC [Shewanella fidelis]MDW4823766.1 sulfurtransferase complex subunit TusC [Shewanella fidelis]
MKKLCIVFKQAPHGTAHGREGLDFALLSASFEQEVSLVFTGEGLLTLLKEQDPESIGCKDYISTLGALGLYDIDTVLVCQESMHEFNLQQNDLRIPALISSAEEISAHFDHVDEVMVF